MVIKFWGTRGSIPVSGLQNVKYGGNTPCIEIKTDDGQRVIVDAGSGIRELGYQMLREGYKEGGKSAILLLSHCHWDHIQGLPFFKPAYVRGNTFTIYGLRSFFKSLESALVGQMKKPYFPSGFFEMGSEFNIIEIPECTVRHGQLKISTIYLNHPDETFGFRLDYKGKSFVYASDNEHIPCEEADDKLIHFAEKADVLVHDTQFTWEEYFDGRVGWGHSVPEVALQSAQLAGVRQLLMFHHDPSHNDDFLDRMLEDCQYLNNGQNNLVIEAARDYQEIHL